MRESSLVRLIACCLFGVKQLLNKWWFIVTWPLWNRFRWKWKHNTKLSTKKLNLELSSAKCRPSCPGINVFTQSKVYQHSFRYNPKHSFWIKGYLRYYSLGFKSVYSCGLLDSWALCMRLHNTIVFKFRTEHGSITAVLCTKFHDDPII